MKQWFQNWMAKPIYVRILSAVSMLCSAAIIVLALLFLTDIYTDALRLVFPLLAVAMLAQAGLYWKKDKALAVFSIMAALFMLGMTVF